MAKGVGSLLTVLLVEDLEDNREVIKRTLESFSDYRLLLATDGREALEAARRGCADLVMLDLHLPEMDGMEVARQIRESRGACRNAKIVAALEAWCDEDIPKPVGFDELKRVTGDIQLSW